MTTAICNELADYQWLAGDEAGRLLTELATDPSSLHTTVARLRRQLSATRAHLIIEQLELRRRAAEKFTHAAQMLFTRTSLEQATDEHTAFYKAKRIQRIESGTGPSTLFRVADLCCGIGGDLLALATRGTAIGVDSNPVVAVFASVNLRTVLNCEIEIRTIDSADCDLSDVTAWHIDPDRRPGTLHKSQGRQRTTSIDHCSPDRTTIDRLLVRNPNAAIKLAPATEIPRDWSTTCEREWVSLDRQCRQQIVWHGDLAQTPQQHRATILRSTPRYSGEGLGEGSPRSIIGTPHQTSAIAHQPQQYIFDVDPAVLAAHLTGTLAAEHRLRALSAGPTYLTGSIAIANDPALACFEVNDVLPFRERTLAQYLRSRNIGQLEIKKRGVDLDPDTFRRRLRLRGNNAATLLITQIARRATAIAAQRIS
jgi:hypothetical protein